jgi:hypothetical protein
VPNKPKRWDLPDNPVYVNRKKEFAIGYDEFQWILRRGKKYRYYGTITHLILNLFEDEVKEATGHNAKTLLDAISKALNLLEKITKDIKLPERTA